MRKWAWLFTFFLFVGPIWAKRQPPPFIGPVDDGIYRFVLRENSQPNKHDVYKGGHVEGYLKATGQKLWERYLYKVRLDKDVERDIQDVFIKKMYLDKPDRLILQNERGEWFVLERRTGALLQVANFLQLSDEKPDADDDEAPKIEPILQGDFYIEAEESVSYGHQKVRAFDVPTGRMLWERKIPSPKGLNGGRSHISFMLLNAKGEVEISFDDSSTCLLEAQSGKIVK